MAPPRLLGRRVDLRPLARSDAPILVRYLADPRVRRGTSMRPVTLEEEEELIDRAAASDEALLLGICVHDQDRLVGSCGLHLGDPRARQAQFGIFIGDPGEWGKGYGTEATRLVVGHGFEALGLERIWLRVFEDNLRGLRAYQRAGFEREAAAAVPGGGARGAGAVTMALHREAWSARVRRDDPTGGSAT